MNKMERRYLCCNIVRNSFNAFLFIRFKNRDDPMMPWGVNTGQCHQQIISFKVSTDLPEFAKDSPLPLRFRMLYIVEYYRAFPKSLLYDNMLVHV